VKTSENVALLQKPGRLVLQRSCFRDERLHESPIVLWAGVSWRLAQEEFQGGHHAGITMFATDMRFARMIWLVAEGRGFESLWLPEHTHIPANRRSPRPAVETCPRSTGILTICSSH
jgi:hypothetical protein